MWRCNLSFSHLKVGVWSCNRENLNKIWFSAHLIVPLQRKDTIMAIQTLYSAKQIEQQFHTGEEPVMVMCSDVNIYVCKYMRSSATAYKLACEFIGTKLANAWQLNTPDFVLVNIRSSHWEGINVSHSISAPSIGFRWLDGVVDITPSTYAKVPAKEETLNQLMKIALFDFWVANEDRNANNANLMYDMTHEQLVSIDYGCIFNTATFEYPLSQLTSTDTILWSDLFRHLRQCADLRTSLVIADRLKADYEESLNRSKSVVAEIIAEMPQEWNVPTGKTSEKLRQLFDEQWIVAVWDNFMECLNENIG